MALVVALAAVALVVALAAAVVVAGEAAREVALELELLLAPPHAAGSHAAASSITVHARPAGITGER